MWGTDDDTRTAYLDTQDVAKMTLAACRREEAANEVMTLAGPKAYSVAEVIQLCEKMGGAEANVSKVPVVLLKATRALTRFFQWTAPAADRLAFAEVLASGVKFDAPMEDTYAKLGMDPPETTTLEGYLEEYFSKILKKLKEVGGQSRQKAATSNTRKRSDDAKRGEKETAGSSSDGPEGGGVGVSGGLGSRRSVHRYHNYELV